MIDGNYRSALSTLLLLNDPISKLFTQHEWHQQVVIGNEEYYALNSGVLFYSARIAKHGTDKWWPQGWVYLMKFKMAKMIIILILLTVVLPMIIPGPDGKPIMSLNDWLPNTGSMNSTSAKLTSKVKEWLFSAKETVERSAGVSVGIERPKLYKWRDENGAWHFSDKSDVQAKNQIVEALPKIQNSMEPPPDIDFGDSDTSSSFSGAKSMSIPFPTSIPVGKIPQLIDDAKNVQKLADDRAKKLNNL